jgi:chromosome segregation ATPase
MMKFRRSPSRQSVSSSQTSTTEPPKSTYSAQEHSNGDYSRSEQPESNYQRTERPGPRSNRSPRSIASSPTSETYNNIHRVRASFEEVPVPVSINGVIREPDKMRHDSRAVSTGRASRGGGGGGGLRVVGTTSHRTLQRSRSTERQAQVQQRPEVQRPEVSSSYDSNDSPGDKKRKSKMEKIRQLQSKNELYKVEFKRVQKDRKLLKKDIEAKNVEMESLTKEIDSRISETSVLKIKLSEALQEIDHNQEDQRRDLAIVKTLSRDLTQAKLQLDQALSRATTLRDNLDDMKEQVKRKDEQIEHLTGEVSNQIKLVHVLEQENVRLRKAAEEDTKDDGKLEELQNENRKLKSELGSTLDRAASMVKEREDAIADLLKENEEMKRMVSADEEKSTAVDQAAVDQDQEVLMQLKAEAEAANMELEEAQDRTAMLEEEIQGLIVRSGEMETEIVRLQDEVEAWQRKASAAEEVVTVVEENAKEKAAEAAKAQKALAEMETRHRTAIANFEAKHRSILADARSKHLSALADADSKHRAALAEVQARQVAVSADDESQGSSLAGTSDVSDAQSRQAMLLQQAVAARQSKSAASAADGSSSWLSGFMKAPEEEELDENQKRIKELEALNTAKEEEIKKLKSETVRLSSGYKEIMYVNKKKIERLVADSEAYVLKTAALERQLAEARGESPETESNGS